MNNGGPSEGGFARERSVSLIGSGYAIAWAAGSGQEHTFLYDKIIWVNMSLEIEAKIGQRGQVVIPKPIREAYDLRPGETVRFGIEDDRIVIRGNEGALQAFLATNEKRPEPEEIDWDEQYAERFV